jgi:hypothetical protein
MPDDQQPDVIAQADQLVEQHKQLARVVAAYNKHLRLEGCSATLANDLTGDYQHELFVNDRGGQGE